MNLLHTRNEPHETPHEIAAAWLLREEAGRLSSADRARLQAWIEADPRHRKAWDDTRLALATVNDNAADPDLMAMRAAALTARGERRWNPRGLAAAALLVVVLAGAALFGPRFMTTPTPQGRAGGATIAQQSVAPDPNSALYSTAIGERSAITLPDGSIATLDTDSALKVAYTGAERGVRLIRGQALFEVAKHKPIPFQVYAGDRRITAVGTKFNVRLDGTGSKAEVSVTLLEGVVNVATLPAASGLGAPAPVVTMAAGELLQAGPAAPTRVAAIDTDRVVSWRAGVLTFDDASLGQAVAEVNRYTTRPISLADPKLAALRISGVFKTGDPEHFAETMAEVFPIRVSHDPKGAPVLEPAG